MAVRRLAAARLASFVGTGAAQIALISSLYDTTGSPGWVAAGMVATHGVQVFCGLFASSLSDRFDRRRVMIVSEMAGGACYLSMALLDGPRVLLATAVLASILTSPFHSASAASIPNLVARERLGWANSLLASGRHLGMTIGPALGGVLVAWTGAGSVFAMNGVSYLVSAVMIRSVHGRFSGAPGDADPGGVLAGIVHLGKDRVLRRLTAAEIVLVAGLGLVQVARVPLSEVLGVGPAGLGLMAGLWGGGLVLGSVAGRKLTAASEPPVFVLGLAGVALATGAIGALPWPVLVMGLHLLVGFADSLDLIAGLGIRQRRTPDRVMSRVIGANASMVVLAQMAGYGLAGTVVGAAGPKWAYVSCAAVVAAGAVICLPVLRWARPAGSGDDEGGGRPGGDGLENLDRHRAADPLQTQSLPDPAGGIG